MSSPVMHLDLLLKLPPDEVFFDFLAQCGLALHTLDADDHACERLRIGVEIERAPLMVRESIGNPPAFNGRQKWAMQLAPVFASA